MPMPCPEPGTLAKLMDGALRPDEAPPLREHVRGCKLCQDTLRSTADERDREREANQNRAMTAPELLNPSLLLSQQGRGTQDPEDDPQVRTVPPVAEDDEALLDPRQMLRRASSPGGAMANERAVQSDEVTLPPGMARRVQAEPLLAEPGRRRSDRAVIPNEEDTQGPPAAPPPLPAARDPQELEAPPPDSTQSLPKGQQFGRYVILQQLGVGGMGVVYSAFDPELSRKVALKLLRTSQKKGINGTNASEGRARLLREAQAMARISHPNIVGVYDVGSLGDDVYVAMELVEGGTLTGWLKTPRTWREVVAMFRYAGRGLAAAHAAGIVHRDFKPDNVLVAHDGRVRVTDFGLARPTVGNVDPSLPPRLGPDEPNLTPDYLLSPLTRAGTIVGTPVYMAPEQFVGEAVDARTDQYSFCVALWEALYGQLPYQAKSVRGLAKAAMAGKLPKLPLDHRVPLSLHRMLLRGLKPNREERWPSMASLLSALEVAAWFRRRATWAALIGTAVLAAVLVGRGFGSTPDATCESPERQLEGVWDPTVKAQVKQAFDQAGVPLRAAAFAAVERDLDRYQTSWTEARNQACDATFVRGDQTRETLELRLGCLDRRRRELAAYVNLLTHADAASVDRSIQHAAALPDLSACADIASLTRRARLPAKEEDRPKVEALRGRMAEAEAYRASGRYPEAVRQATQIASEARELRFRPLEAEVFLLLGRLLDSSGDYPAAEQALQEATWAAVAAQLLDVEAEAMVELVKVVGQRQSRHAEGHRWGRHAASVLEALSDPPRLAADLVDNLGTLSRAEGDYEQSLANHQRALALREKTLGPDHLELAGSLQSLATTYTALGRREEALACYERALKLLEGAFGFEHPRVSSVAVGLATAQSSVGRHEEALALFRRAARVNERIFGPDSTSLGPTLNGLAGELVKTGNLDEALDTQERALSLMEAGLGHDHPRLGTFHLTLAEVHMRRGDYTAALEHSQRAQAIREKALGPDHFDLGQSLFHIADAYLSLDQPRRALPVLERALALREGSRAYPRMLASIRFGLARALVLTGGDKERARRLAALAQAGLSAEGSDARVQLYEVGSWLDRQGGSVVRMDPP